MAEPRTPLERLCRDYSAMEEELEGSAARIGTFEDDDLALLDEALLDGVDDGDLDHAGAEQGALVWWGNENQSTDAFQVTTPPFNAQSC